MRSDPRAWAGSEEVDRFVLQRSWRALVAPYVPVIAATIGWYPFVFLVALPLAGSPRVGSNLALALLVVPMVLLAMWARKLAAERRRIVLVRREGRLHLAHRELAIADVARVLVLGGSRGHGTLGLVFRREQEDAFLELVTMRDGENAAELAARLASWLAVDLEIDPPALARARATEAPRSGR